MKLIVDDRPLQLDVMSEPLRMEAYSRTSVAVRGSTREWKTELKNAGGRFVPKLKGGAGWIFSAKHVADVRHLVDTINRLAQLDEVTIHLQDKPQVFAALPTGRELRVVQLTQGTFHVERVPSLFDDELRALGCEKVEQGEGSGVWYFTRNKLTAVTALVNALNKLI